MAIAFGEKSCVFGEDRYDEKNRQAVTDWRNYAQCRPRTTYFSSWG